MGTDREQRLEAALLATDDEVGPACVNVPVPPTITTDDAFREAYGQGYRHALADVRQWLRGKGSTPPEATQEPPTRLWTRDTDQQAIRDLYYYAEGSRDENLLRLANRIRFAVPADPGRCLWRERDGMWWPACGKSDVGMEISLVEHFNCCTGCGRPVQVEK